VKKPIHSAKNVVQATSDQITKRTSQLASTVLGVGRSVLHAVIPTQTEMEMPSPGSAPGIEHYLQKAENITIPTRITSIDYGANFHETKEYPNIETALAAPRKEGQLVRWLNIDGLDPKNVDAVCRHYGIHTLSAEDTLNTYQRPKLEFFDKHLQVIVRQIRVESNKLRNEQITFFLMQGTLVSFQQEQGDVFDPVRKRLENVKGRFRSNQADYLLYALLDCIVDHLFPLLENYGIALENLEEEISNNPSPACQSKLFGMKRDLSQQRRILWPIREIIDGLCRDESGLIKDELKTFYRDVHDHSMQVIDLLEIYRETASGLSDLYQSSVGNRMNEIMKMLTIMASFFIPITFFAGVYGMNFEHMPELGWEQSYPVFWGICIAVSISLAIYFKRKGWIGGK
jgi:magnesium transporter